LIIGIDEARAGMTLAAPVADPEDPLRDLLNRGYCLEDAVISRLRELGVASLYVDYPGLDDLDRHLLPQLSPVRSTMYRQICDTMRRVEDRTAPGVSFPDYYATTYEMVTTLLSQGAHPVYMEKIGGLGADAVSHATTVAHVALMLGLRLEKYLIQQRARLDYQHAREVVNLGVAGMLHDIGKMKLPAEVRERCELDAGDHGLPADEDPDARELWESHARLGYEMLRGGVECTAATAVLHHHQHYDGTGFPIVRPRSSAAAAAATTTTTKTPAEPIEPAPLKGRDIHVFARILYVADLYANLARPPRSNKRRGNLEVLHLMRTQYAKWMDPVVFAALQSVAPPFLPGSKVVLGDRSMAAVVSVRSADPYVPVVRRFKPDGEQLVGPELDLRQRGAPALVALPGGTPVAQFMPTGGAVTLDVATV
jgi:hypothetical protein